MSLLVQMIGNLFVFISNAKVAREVVVTELGSNDDDRRNAWDDKEEVYRHRCHHRPCRCQQHNHCGRHHLHFSGSGHVAEKSERPHGSSSEWG